MSGLCPSVSNNFLLKMQIIKVLSIPSIKGELLFVTLVRDFNLKFFGKCFLKIFRGTWLQLKTKDNVG